MKDPNKYPPGWDLERVRRIIQHYESQTDEEAVAEDARPAGGGPA